MASNPAKISDHGSPHTLSTSDKLSLAWRIPLLVFRFFYNFVSLSLSRADVSKLHWRQRLPLSFLKASRVTFTREQQDARIRWPLTGPSIQKYCLRQGLEHRRVPLSNSVLQDGRHVPAGSLHFVVPAESQSSGPTIFYLHGGGYYNPIRAEAHIPFLLLCATACKARQVVFLEYSLSPDWPYPCQLVQSAQGLRYLLDDEPIKASDIIIGGDSAGGHLAASLLLHIVQPSPYASRISLGNDQLKAVFFVSPWLALSEKYSQSAPNDYLGQDGILQFTGWFSPAMEEIWANPLETEHAPAAWRQAYPAPPGNAVCRKVMVVAGSSETLLDSCVLFGRDLIGCTLIHVNNAEDFVLVKEKSHVLAVATGDVHVQPALDSVVKYRDGLTTGAVLAFLESL